MSIYFLLLFILIITQFSAVNRKITFWFVSIILMLILAFRGPTVGIDLPGYIELFKFATFNSRDYVEPLYLYYTSLIHYFSDSAFVFIAVTSVTTLAPLLYIIYKESEDQQFSLFFLVIGMHYLFMFSGVRQSISISFIILSFYYLKKAKKLHSFAWYLLAGLFHSSSFIFFFVFFLGQIRLSKKTSLLFSWATFLLSFVLDNYMIFSLIQGTGNNMMNYYSTYSTYLVDYQIPVLRIILSTIPYIFIIHLIFMNRECLDKNENLYAKIFIIGVIFNNVVITNPIGFRLMKAPLLLTMLLLPQCIKANMKKRRFVYSCLFALLYVYNIYSRYLVGYENDIVPFKFYEF